MTLQTKHDLPIPLQSYGPHTTACLLAVIAGADSMRQVQAMTGTKSVATVYDTLLLLREEGLVTWQFGKQGTLQPRARLLALIEEGNQ